MSETIEQEGKEKSERPCGRCTTSQRRGYSNSRSRSFFVVQQIIWELRLFFPVGTNG
jgi:hypothetical protein